ncbi:MAG: glycine--tRNA ligase subunit beta, partial [Sphingomonas sp.]
PAGEGRGEGATGQVADRAPGSPDSPSPNPLPQAGEGYSLADLAERAARLAKADLVTGMVGEFPELQGLMGGYYAAAQGEPAEVAEAIRDHYKPVGQGDDVPTAPVTVAVSLADKLDTLFAFFDIGEFPTGSKDPFALRRSALASIRLILDNDLAVLTDAPIEFWLGQSDQKKELSEIDIQRRSLITIVLDFLLDRLAVQLRERGVRHDFVEASRRWGTRDDGRLDRVASRAKALQAFVTTEDGTNLLAGYKRAANILKKEGFDGTDVGVGGGIYEAEPAESALIEALDAAEPKAESAIEAEDFEGAMAALATLRAPIDTFFESVIVNDPDPEKRAARLTLLLRMRDAVHKVADFSRIEG